MQFFIVIFVTEHSEPIVILGQLSWGGFVGGLRLFFLRKDESPLCIYQYNLSMLALTTHSSRILSTVLCVLFSHANYLPKNPLYCTMISMSPSTVQIIVAQLLFKKFYYINKLITQNWNLKCIFYFHKKYSSLIINL